MCRTLRERRNCCRCSVGGRVLLLGATGQSVTLLTEVAEFAETLPAEPVAETPEEVAAFADYLARVGVTAPGGTGAESTRASLAAATDRLQSLLSRGPK
jgi:flagellar biogenesis protein FliO